MEVSWSRTIAPRDDDLTLGGAELEEVMILRILGITLDSKLTFETHLLEVVSKAAGSLGVVHRAGKLFNFHVCSIVVSIHMFCPAWSFVS